MYQHGRLTPPSSPDTATKPTEAQGSSCACPVPPIQPSIEDLDGLPLGGSQSAEIQSCDASSSENRLSQLPAMPRPYEGSYQRRLSCAVLGQGAWSTVYGAISSPAIGRSSSGIFPVTPPTTPEKCTGSKLDRVVAVKKLARRDGKKILDREARVLTYLHSQASCERYLVGFYGYDAASSAIVMECVPLTLEAHVSKLHRTALSSATMLQPTIGMKEWCELASDLINGLVFLHGHKCIHGDIKPTNILLRRTFHDVETEMLEPLFCDFSSSRVASDSRGVDNADGVTAVTPDYTSPELLRALNPRRSLGDVERAITTKASDIFALGVTMLFAAIGISPYAQARISLQKTAMAAEGIPLRFARDGDGGSRVPGEGLVEQVLKLALERDPENRICAKLWEKQTRQIVQDFSGKVG